MVKDNFKFIFIFDAYPKIISSFLKKLVLHYIPWSNTPSLMFKDMNILIFLRPGIKILLISELSIFIPCITPFNTLTYPFFQNSPALFCICKSNKLNTEPASSLLFKYPGKFEYLCSVISTDFSPP